MEVNPTPQLPGTGTAETSHASTTCRPFGPIKNEEEIALARSRAIPQKTRRYEVVCQSLEYMDPV